MYFIKSIRKDVWIQILLFGFLTFSILWRGGKSIDATWLLVGVTCCVVVLSKSTKESPSHVPLKIWLPAMFIAIWYFVSYMQSSTANYGVDEVLRTSSVILLFFWAIRYGQEERGRLLEHGLTNFIRVISIVVITACVIGVLVYIFQPVNRFVGTFFDARFHTDYWPNAWACFLLLSWPMVYYWLFSGWEIGVTRTQRIVGYLIRAGVLSILLAALFLSYSRGAIIAFTGQLTLWAGITYVHIKDKQQWTRIAVSFLGMVLMATILFLFVNSIRSNIHDVVSLEEKVTFSSDEGTSSVSERSLFWRDAFSLANKKPVFGWGPYSFRFVQPHIQQGVLATSDHPHNVFLKLAMETGWLTSFAFLFILITILARSIDNEIVKKRTIAPLDTLILLSVVGVLSHSLIDYNLQFVGIALPFWLLLGFLAGSASRSTDTVIPFSIARSVELFLTVVICIIALFEGVFLVTSSIGRHAEDANNYRKALVWYERSKLENFSRDMFLSETKIHIQKAQFTTAERSLWKYFAVNNEDARAWKLQGQIYEGMYQFDKAIQAYEQAYSYGKYNDIGILRGLILSYINNNQRGIVDSRKPEFDILIKEYSNAILLNTHYIDLSSNVEEFIEICDLFAELYPDEAPVYIVLAAKADDHASVERERLDSRPPGFLW